MKAQNRPQRVLILCFAAYSLIYTGRMNLSVASPLLESGAILNKEQIGLLGSMFFAVYALGRVVNGIICDRVNPKPFLATGMLLSGLCNILISTIPPVWVIYVLWGMNGFFQSMLWGAALKNVSSAYSDSESSKKAAMTLSASVGVGTLLGVVLPAAFASVGLRQVFLLPGVILIAFGSLLIILLPSGLQVELTHDVKAVNCIKNPQVMSMLIPAAAHGAIKENLTLWMPLLFLDMFGLNLKQAAAYIFMMPTATLIGRIIFPYWYRLCGNDDTKTLLSSFGICAAAMLPFVTTNVNVWLAVLIFITVSIATSVLNAELISIYPLNFQSSNQVSAVSGILDSFTYVGSAIGSAIFGYVIQIFGYSGMVAVWVALAILSITIMVIKTKKEIISY